HNEVAGARQPPHMHSELALPVMERLGLLAALLYDLLETLVVRRLELKQVLRLGRFRQADALAVALAANVPTNQPDAILLPVNLDADGLQVCDKHLLPTVARAEDRQLAAVDLFRRRYPAERVPERSVAFRVGQADANAEAVVVFVSGFVGGIDGPHGACGWLRDGDHG